MIFRFVPHPFQSPSLKRKTNLGCCNSRSRSADVWSMSCGSPGCDCVSCDNILLNYGLQSSTWGSLEWQEANQPPKAVPVILTASVGSLKTPVTGAAESVEKGWRQSERCDKPLSQKVTLATSLNSHLSNLQSYLHWNNISPVPPSFTGESVCLPISNQRSHLGSSTHLSFGLNWSVSSLGYIGQGDALSSFVH